MLVRPQSFARGVCAGRSRQRQLRRVSIDSSRLVGYQEVRDKKVGIITLQSPRTLNALTVEMGREFEELVHELRHALRNHEKREVSGAPINAVVLQGEGDKAFSAGGDLDWLKSLQHNSIHHNVDLMLEFYHSFLCIRQLPVPVVCAISGPAMGAGACLALACDLRVAPASEETVALGFPFSKLGISSGMGGSFWLSRALGSTCRATEILLRGQSLTGPKAYELGLINQLSPNVKQAAVELAADIASKHPVAVRAMTQNLRSQQEDGTLQRVLHQEAYAQAVCYARSDWGEGLDAVVEKREPIFKDYFEE